MTTADGFVARHGPMQYKPYKLRKYSRDGLCEVCNQTPRGGKPILLFDHCHAHGWVRGLLCNWCNDEIGFHENGRGIGMGYAKYLDRILEYLHNCPGCHAGEVNTQLE